MRLGATLALLVAATSLSAVAGPLLDGAVIVNSGSTNAAGWSIAIRSDGSGTLTEESRGMSAAQPQRSFSVPLDVTARFFTDVAAARAAHALGRPCMKSASFGTRLNVTWHGWTSPDLSCPPASAAISALGADVAHITTAANPESGFRRVRLPVEPRRLPEQTPQPF